MLCCVVDGEGYPTAGMTVLIEAIWPSSIRLGAFRLVSIARLLDSDA
jgi:hypothetical protein